MDLTELRERVRKAEGPDRELDAAIWPIWHPVLNEVLTHWTDEQREELVPRFTASIDAALALVERLLLDDSTSPITRVSLEWAWSYCSCRLYKPKAYSDGITLGFHERPDSELALCILDALLTALIEKEKGDG